MERNNLKINKKIMKQLTGNEYFVLTVILDKFTKGDTSQIYLASMDIINGCKPLIKISRTTVGTILKKLEEEHIIKLRRVKGCAYIAYKGKNYYEYTSKVTHIISM